MPQLHKHFNVVRHYMRAYLRLLVGLLVTLFGYRAIKQEFGAYNVGVLSELNYLPFVLVILLTIVTLLLDNSYFKRDRKFYQFSFSFFCLALCLIVLIKIINRNSIDNSNTVLKVVNKAGAGNVWQFAFKDSKRFTLTDYSLFGHTVYYGKYDKRGDTLQIVESNYNGEIKEFPTTGIIKADTIYWNNFDTMHVERE